MHSARFCGKDGLSIEQNAECWLDLARFAPKFKDEATGKGDSHFRLSAKCGQKRLYRHVMRRVNGAQSGFIGDVLQKFGGGQKGIALKVDVRVAVADSGVRQLKQLLVGGARQTRLRRL